MEIKISDIKIGERHRKDHGDIEALAESIENLGLLQPIGITENNELVFGERRIKAHELLSRDTIKARVVDIEHIIEGELAENEVRKDFTVSERVAILKAVKEALGERRGRPSENNVPISAQFEGEKTRDIAAKKAGFGGHQTARDAEKVVDNGTPELVEAMDSGKTSISVAAEIAKLPPEEQNEALTKGDKEVIAKAKQLREEASKAKKEKRKQELDEQRQQIAEGKVAMPEGVFEVVTMDPPWNYGREYDPNGSRVANPYPEMTQAQLLEMQPPFADDCVLFLWTTHKFIWDAKELMDKWDFEYKANLVWNKQMIGMGHWLRMQCEFCLVGIKGKPVFENTTWRDIIEEPRREHSRKPDTFYKMVEDITVGRRLEYFSREARTGWEILGNDTEKF